jgi:hypothetical protein
MIGGYKKSVSILLELLLCRLLAAAVKTVARRF